jgi:hypothetical protein
MEQQECVHECSGVVDVRTPAAGARIMRTRFRYVPNEELVWDEEEQEAIQT